MQLDKNLFKKAVDRYIDKYGATEEEAIKVLKGKGPSFLFSVGCLLSSGWRAGYTKQTLEKRTENRRIKNKRAAKARRINNLKNK